MSSRSQIPVVIIGGYLGAGKTTLINHCLQNGLANAAIIVNDFGDINIDASLISQFSSDTLELSNGCICCSIGESLADTFFSILDRPQPPELIVIETSGVSDPSSVAAYTHISGLTNAGILVLVDAQNAISVFNQPLLRTTFERQIKAAHLLAMTKSELTSDTDRQSVRQLLSTLAPATAVVEATANVLSLLVDTPLPPPHVTEISDEHPLSGRTHHFDQAPSLTELHSFLDELDVSVIRAKGIIELSDFSRVLVQKTGPHLSITPTSLSPSGLVLLVSE